MKILLVLILYYVFIILMFSVQGSILSDAGYNTTVELNNSELSSGEIDSGGFFSTGVSFARFFGFVVFGVGLPSDTPIWISTIWIIIASGISVFTVGFLFDSIWGG